MARKKVAQRWVECLHCGHQFESRLANPQCGQCSKRGVKEIPAPVIKLEVEEPKGKGRKLKVQEEIKDKGFEITIGATPVHFSVDELADLQAMVRTGLGKNVSEVIKRCIRNELRRSLGGESMVEKKSPEERLTEYSMQEIAEAKAEKLRAEAEKIKSRPEVSDTELDKLEQQMTKQMRLRALEANLKRMEKGEASQLEQMMTMQMYKDMGFVDGRANQTNEALLKRLDNIEARFKKTEEDRKYDELRKLVMDVVAKPRGASEAELLTKMAEIQGKRDENLEKVRGELAQARQEVLGAQLGAKIERLEQAMAGGKKLDITEVKSVIKDAKELSKVMGPSTEKSGTDKAIEIIDKTLGSAGGQKMMEQIGTGVGQAISTKKQQPQPPVQYVPVQEVPEGQVSAKIVSTKESSNPKKEEEEEEDYSDLVNISTGN